MRHSGSGLLAVNDFVYTTSHRIKVFHDDGSPKWRYGANNDGKVAILTFLSNRFRLSINPVELSDGGLYECQVSTTPHTSHFMYISVIGEFCAFTSHGTFGLITMTSL